MIESEIRWGTGYDNALPFTYPRTADDTRTWRRPVPGSRTTRNGAGTADAWVNGRDYMLAIRARHFSPQYWAGLGLQDFLDYAGAKNTFRVIPDTNYPNFYVDNCYLDEPFDDPQPELEQSDGSQSIGLVIRQQAVDFSVAMRGLMFEYVPGKSLTDPSSMLATYSRATTANRTGRDLVVASEASGTLRDRHFVLNPATSLYERSALVEKASANVCLHSENFTGWTAVGSPTIGVSAHSASGVVLDLLGDDDGGALEYLYQNITFTADGVKAVSIYVKAGTSQAAAGSEVNLLDQTAAGTPRLSMIVTFSGAGVPSVSASTGTYLGYEALKGGVYRLLFVTTSVTAANTNELSVRPARTLAQTGNIYAGGVQAENSTTPTSYKSTTTGTVARNADSLAFPFTAVPQSLSLYCKMVVPASVPSGDDTHTLWIGDGTTGFRLWISSQNIRAYHYGPASNSVADITDPAAGDLIEMLATLASDGSATASASTNGGAVVSGSAGATGAFPSAWNVQTISITPAGVMAVCLIRVALGVRTMAEMRAI